MPNRMKCCVLGCRKYSGASFYRFPMDEARCSYWVQRVNPSLSAKTIEQLHTLRVCGIHFTDNQYMNPKRIRLVHNAVPSLHLPTNRPINVSSVSGEDHTMSACLLCHIPWCKAREDNVTLHRFPVGNDIQCRQWLNFSGLMHLYPLSKSELQKMCLCSRHFRREDRYNNNTIKRLVPGAVPSIVWPPEVSSTANEQVLSISETFSSGHSSSPRAQLSMSGMEQEVIESGYASSPRAQLSMPGMEHEINESGHSSSPRAQHSMSRMEPEVHESEHLSSPKAQHSMSGMEPEVHESEHLFNPRFQYSKPTMGYEVHKTDSVPDASKVSVEGLVTDSKSEVDCIVDTPPSPCPESPPPPFTLHNDIANLQLDLDVLRKELKEGLATLSKKLRDRIDAIMVRVHQLILICREDQKLAAAESNPTPEMELESQRLKRLSLYLSMVLTFLRKWKEDEVKEINRYIHIEQRMNWLNKLAIVVVNKDPNELEKALKIAENMT